MKERKVKIQENVPIEAMKTKGVIYFSQDVQGNLWFVTFEGSPVVYKYDGTSATRHEFEEGTFIAGSFASDEQGTAYFGTSPYPGLLIFKDGGVWEARNEAIKEHAWAHCIAVLGGAVYCTIAAFDPRTAITCYEEGKWRRSSAAPKFHSIRSLTPFEGRLIALENEKLKGHILAPDGSKLKSFVPRDPAMNILSGPRCFLTYNGFHVEVWDQGGQRLHYLDIFDTMKQAFQQAMTLHALCWLDDHSWLALVKPRHDPTAAGLLCRIDATTLQATAHEVSKHLQPKMAVSQMTLDKAGKIWLKILTGSGQTEKHVFLVIGTDGKASMIKNTRA